jgi:hypothetical protein
MEIIVREGEMQKTTKLIGHRPNIPSVRQGGIICKSLVLALLSIFVLSPTFSFGAEQITACDLVDKATAGQILDRPISSGPRPSKSVLSNNVRTYCDFRAEGNPFVLVNVSLSEFKSPHEAKAWADQANTPKEPSFTVEIEKSIGDSAVWISGRHSAFYVARKGAKVLEINIRGASGGGVKFEVTSSMKPKMRKAVQRAIEKL